MTKVVWDIYSLRELTDNLKLSQKKVWSARVSTGLFGLTACSSGNRGPKNQKEVLLSVGNCGLSELVDLGFIPCPTCKPESNDENFWKILRKNVQEKYGLTSLKEFCDKTILPFDVRRLELEKIANIAWGLPSRFYLPKNLSEQEVEVFANRLKKIQGSSLTSSIPKLGFYDSSSPTRFTEYSLE